MCLILFAYRWHPSYRLILAANRDEFYERPAAAADFWEEAPHVLAGRDLRAGGTWLGVARSGRIGAVTNYRDPDAVRSDAPSRGGLVSGFLLGTEGPEVYLRNLDARAGAYNGFNLLVGDAGELFWYCNRSRRITKLAPGLYGVSNHLLDTPWPKVRRGKAAMKRVLSRAEAVAPEALFDVLLDNTRASPSELPDTGVGPEWERILSSPFITSPVYGTRSSTVLLMDAGGRVTFIERTFTPSGKPAQTVSVEFSIET